MGSLHKNDFINLVDEICDSGRIDNNGKDKTLLHLLEETGPFPRHTVKIVHKSGILEHQDCFSAPVLNRKTVTIKKQDQRQK